MANGLTGDFDVVAEMSLPRINRLLAAQHQAGVFPHSFTVRIDGRPSFDEASPPARPRIGGIAEQPARAAAERRIDTGARRAVLRRPIVPMQQLMPGSLLIEEEGAIAAFIGHRAFIRAENAIRAEHITFVQATAAVQASTPTVTLATSPGTPRVTLHFDVRAHVTPDPGSTFVPEFVHGDVALTVDVAQLAVQQGTQFVLDFDFVTGNLDVKFTPAAGSGTAQKDVSTIENAIYSLMSSGFVCGNALVDVPTNVRDMQFKALGGPLPAAALLLSVEGTFARPDHGEFDTPPSPASVTNVFVRAEDDFAIAIGREFLTGTLASAVTTTAEDVRRQMTDANSIISFAFIPYKLTVPGTNIFLEPGILRVMVTFHAHRETGLAVLAPEDVDIRLIQEFTLSLQNGRVAVAPASELRVEVSPGFVGDGMLVDEVNKQMTPARRQQLVDAANVFVGRAFDDLDLETVLRGLQVPSAEARYTAVEVTTEGIILRGKLDLGAWQKPTAASDALLTMEGGQKAIRLDAFASWIPGGTVQSYTWKNGGPLTEEHAFVKFVPHTGAGGPGKWCVEVKGTQTMHDGGLANVSRWSCLPFSVIYGALPKVPRIPDEVRRDRHAIVVVRPGPDPVPDAYIDPWGAGLVSPATRANLLVHFADEFGPAAVRVFSEAVERSGLENASFCLILVLPRGQLGRAVAAGTGHPDREPRQTNLVVSLTEDFEGSWRRTFDVGEPPATILVGALGHVRWQHRGRLDVERLAAALREHAVTGGPLRYHPMSLAVQPGDRAPDFRLELAPGHGVPLRRLRRQPMTLVFWTSWAEPSLAELRRVEAPGRAAARPERLVVAINDGEEPEHACEVFRRNGFTSHLVTDPEREIARAYGVHCWPTTVDIEGHGRIWNVQLGSAHHHESASGAAMTHG